MSVAFFVIDPRQMQTTTIFDGADHPIEVMDAERNVTTTAYDDDGKTLGDSPRVLVSGL